jgi:hypothetical protein
MSEVANGNIITRKIKVTTNKVGYNLSGCQFEFFESTEIM